MKKNKGITLIALVVTIIVLLILAGVVIDMLTGENGILGREKSVVYAYEKEEILERLKFATTNINIKYQSNSKRNSLASYYTNYNNYSDYTTFVANSNFDVETYPIQEYNVSGTKENKYVDISLKKKNGRGTVYRYIIKLGQDLNSIDGTIDDDIEAILDEMTIGEISEAKSSAYTINYVLNGGTNPATAVSSYRTGIVQTYPKPTYEGYVFDGWYEQANYSGEKVTSTSKNSTGDITVYAKWLKETDSDFFTWTFENNLATITGLSDEGESAYTTGNLSVLVLPAKYNGTTYIENVGQTVTKIGSNAFKDRTNINRLFIGDTVESSGSYSFYGCTGITELTVPISLDVAGWGTGMLFKECVNMTKINFTKGNGSPLNYTSTEAPCYRNTPWYISTANEINITLEEGIESIGNNMFYGCTGLKTINFPSSLKSIGTYAFYNCANLEKNPLKLPESLITMGRDAFNGCTKITGTLELPSGISSIEYNTFCNCTGINRVILEDTISSLGSSAFSGCSGVNELTAPISLNLGASNVFSNWTNVTKVNLTKGTGTLVDYSSSGSANYQKTPWYLSRNNEINVTLEEGIESIGNHMFDGCTGLKTINFPSSLKSIGTYAFYNCANLEKNPLKLPESLITMGRDAFYGCTKITGTLELPSGISSLEPDVFYNCTGINKVVLGDTITSLSGRVFYGCSGIEELVLPISLNVANYTTFSGCVNIKQIYFTKGSGSGIDYKSNSSPRYVYTPWYIAKANLQTIILEKGITSIGTYTFNGLNNTVSYYYTGSESDWESISIGQSNNSLTGATINYNYQE